MACSTCTARLFSKLLLLMMRTMWSLLLLSCALQALSLVPCGYASHVVDLGRPVLRNPDLARAACRAGLLLWVRAALLAKPSSCRVSGCSGGGERDVVPGRGGGGGAGADRQRAAGAGHGGAGAASWVQGQEGKGCGDAGKGAQGAVGGGGVHACVCERRCVGSWDGLAVDISQIKAWVKEEGSELHVHSGGWES